MSIARQLSYSLGLKDQSANWILAIKIVSEQDQAGFFELTEILDSNSPKRMKMDAALTIAYVAEEDPDIVSPHFDFLIRKLSDTIDRVSWGSMIALSHLVDTKPGSTFTKLPLILDAMDSGGVVCRDHGFKILVSLYSHDQYEKDVFFIILEQLSNAPHNQIGQYAERLVSIVKPDDVDDLVKTLEIKREELDNPHHLKRMNKILAKLMNRK